MIQAVYFLGLGLALALKVAFYVYKRPAGRSIFRAIGNFFFADSNAAYTTLTTVAVAWLLAAVYVGSIQGMAEYVAGLPKHPAVAFVLGIAMESAAPPVFKAIISRISGSA